MKTIYKYEVPLQDSSEILMPQGAKILSVQEQRGRPQIWALVDRANKPEARKFVLKGTGHEADGVEYMQFIGTVQIGQYVFHLFEDAGPFAFIAKHI